MKLQIVKILYALGFTLFIPLIILRLLYKSLGAPLYRQRIAERFGFFKAPVNKGGLWVHAVSVGEVVAAIPIVQYLQKHYPQKTVIFTTMTPTGSKRVKQAFGDSVFHVYIPYDIPWVLNRFFSKVVPTLCIILETELWPNVLFGCHARQIPVILANAHLSERSVRGYQRISSISKAMLDCLSAVAAQSQRDAERFLAIGLNPEKLSVMGNIKFDVSYPNKQEELDKANAWRKNLGSRPVWIAASTHPGEEELILAVHQIVCKTVSNALLILVPRHPERFKNIQALIQQQGFNMITRSSGLVPTENTEVFLGDTMGELLCFYQASDIAFVGGSLVPIGGHNVLEPAALGIPILTGPYLHNYVDISELLVEAGGMKIGANPEELATEIVSWLNNPEQRWMAGKQAYQVVQNNQGTAKKLCDLIDNIENQ